MDRRSFMRLAGLCPVLPLLPRPVRGEPTPALSEGRRKGAQVVLRGDYGYAQKVIRNLPAGATIDAQHASFTVANSRNGNPDFILSCKVGTLPTNSYPVVVRNSPGVRFIGGRFNGQVPLSSDWRQTYCNSAALLLKDGTASATVEGVRARRCWDGIRFADQADGFRLKASWLSEIRDDAVENDYLVSGTIEDCLFDGCFSGISLDPASNNRDGRDQTVTIDRTLIRMQPYLSRGEFTHQAPIKVAEVSPKLRITGSIFALSSPNMRGSRRLQRAWQRLIESHDNTLLWLPNEPIPSTLPLPPSGFRLLTGADARAYWNKARQQWVTAHPEVNRFADEAS
ncbi:hypothetical protein [Mesorhizobium sp. ANAO-SY3R2]|uniref:hypothetical protein n=1 Tax=Mesorhizobium sp. ANAO-SY3R2 TaxID=3166644 RepID=UPI0036710BFD